MVQRARIVQAQALDIDDFQPGVADLGRDHRQVRQLTVGEHILLDEFTSPASHRTAVDMFGGDAVVHHQTALFHRAEQGLAVLRQVRMPDVFEHADADHFVETTVLR
ncbi:hypothetical protein D3C84_761540 [compost metagenome]